MTVRITAGLLCDAVRRENNGKLLIIGAYPGSVMFERYPAVVAFTFLARMEYDSASQSDLKIRIKIGDKVNQEIEGTVDAAYATQEWAAIQLQPIEITEPTSLTVEQSGDDGGWSAVFQIPLGTPTL